jgi:hypothetical protein
MGKFREIVHEAAFDRDLEGLFGSTPRADEFVRAAVWALHRDAECGLRISEAIWALDSARLPEHEGGRFVLLYTFNDERVHLLSLVWDGTS